MNTYGIDLMGRRRRRRHSAEFKAAVIQECRKPGVSMAAVALARLWAIMHRVFETAAKACEALDQPQLALAAKLRQASPHWMRHTHATHALANGADLLTVRNNLRHASIATTSIYLRSEEVKRGQVFS